MQGFDYYYIDDQDDFTEKSFELNPTQFEHDDPVVEEEKSIKIENDFGIGINLESKCEICHLEFSEEKYNGHKGNMRSALRFHYYVDHFKLPIDEALENSNSQCPMEKCSFRSQNLPKLIRHYIGKQHGILEKLIEKELPENKKNIEEKSGLGNTTTQFENDDQVEGKTIKVENNFGSGNPAESISCEICNLEFSEDRYNGNKGNMRNALRFHYYAKHFKILIDEELEKSNSQCPMEKCSFSSQNLPKLVQHYIGKQHGILEKLIEKEVKENKNNIEEQDILTEKSRKGNTITQLEYDDDVEEKTSIKVENNFGSGNPAETIKCEICDLEFSEDKYHGNKGNMRSALRFHYYVEHFKLPIDEALENSNSQCPIEKCSFSSQNLPKLIRHYIGKQHGILEKLIEKELPENKSNIEEQDIFTEKSRVGNNTTQFDNDDHVEGKTIKVENDFGSGNPAESIACEICNLEFSEDKYNGNKGNMNSALRFHYYAKHFKDPIDEALENSNDSQCPIENCSYSSQNIPNLIRHFIGKQHGILDKLIEKESKGNKSKIEEQDNFTEKSKDENNPTDSFENDNTFDDDINVKRRGTKSVICELCGFEFSREKYGANMFNTWRMHLYEKHFRKNIDKEVLKSESFTSCPLETCNFRTKTPMKINIVKHYIGKQHGILENLIQQKISDQDQSPARGWRIGELVEIKDNYGDTTDEVMNDADVIPLEDTVSQILFFRKLVHI